MHFSQIIAQDRSKNGFTSMVRQQRLPHAILVLGAEGTGTLPLSLSMAQYLLCAQPTEEDACGQCPSCIKMKHLEHPDLLLSYPTIAPKPNTKPSSHYYSKEFREFVKQTPYASVFDWLQFINAENKQGNITADECRDIIEKLSLKSYEGGRKVLVLWQPEYLGKEGNILLKIIEEPPQDTVIIMAATQAEEILPTIVSRMQSIRLSPLPTAAIAEALVARAHADPRTAAQCAQLANGSYAQALQRLQHQTSDIFPEIKTWFNHLFTNNGKGISDFAEDQAKNGREQQKNFLEWVVKMLEQTLQARYAPQVRLEVAGEEEQFVRKLAAMPLPYEALQGMIAAINSTAYNIERNAHSKTQIHALSLRLQYLIKGKKLPEELA